MPTSLDTYFPFDAGAGANVTESQWRDMARLWSASGPIEGELNAFSVYADSTGMQVKVRSGHAWVHGHYGEKTAETTLAIAAAHATLARIDVVVLRADFTNNRIELDVLTGTAAGSPAVPALTQSSAMWEVSLANIAVAAAASTIAAGNVTDTRGLIQAPDGAWTAYTPVLSGTGWTIGNGVLECSYKRLDGRTIRCSIRILVGTTTVMGTGQLKVTLPTLALVTLPVNSHTGNAMAVDVSATAPMKCTVTLEAANAVFWCLGVVGSLIQMIPLGSGVPFATAVGDYITADFTFQSAT